MSLLHKKGDTTNLNNYRPESFTRVDYKILTYILAESCYVKGRFIRCHIKLLHNTSEYAKMQNTSVGLK